MQHQTDLSTTPFPSARALFRSDAPPSMTRRVASMSREHAIIWWDGKEAFVEACPTATNATIVSFETAASGGGPQSKSGFACESLRSA